MRQERVEIVSNESIGEKTHLIRLQSEYLCREARAGQFLHVRVADTLDPLLRRPLSLHRRYEDCGRFDLLYQVHGRGTRLLAGRRAGEVLDLIGPLGKGFPVAKGRLYMVAGGMGVAPFPAVVDDLCADTTQIVAFVGAKKESGLLCVEEFESMGVEVRVATEDGSTGFHGLVSDLLKSAEAPDTIFCCGPAPMAREIVRYALENGIACEVSMEERMACGVGMCRGCAVIVNDGEDTHYERVCADGPVFPAARLRVWAGDV